MQLTPKIVITLLLPNGSTMDVTDRATFGIGTMTRAVEDDLTELVHSDIELTLNDPDGVIADLFAEAKPTDTYEVIIDRETQKRRPKYERVFAGILDLPWSLSIDRQDRSVSMQVFSYSKLLERESAEPIRRNVTGLAGSVSSGTATVTLTSGNTDDLAAGDEIMLTDDNNEETRTIQSVDSSSQVTTTENWSDSFTAAELELLTPYHRNMTIAALVALLFEQAGITSYDIDITQQLAGFPIGTKLNTDGLPATEVPISIVEDTGKIHIGYSTAQRKSATTPQSGFSTESSDPDAQGDWRPYGSEPVSILEDPSVDGGQIAWDHANARKYTLVDELTPGPPQDIASLKLFRNGSEIKILDTYGATNAQHLNRSIEYDPTEDRVWYTYRRHDDSDEELGYYDVSTTGAVNIGSNAADGMRRLNTLGYMAHQRGTTLRFYRIDTKAEQASITVPDRWFAWTMRELSGQIIGLYRKSGAWRCRVLDSDTLDQVADYEVSASTGASQGTPPFYFAFLTLFDDTSETVGVGFAGGEYFVLSKSFAGVVPYADFDGMSCGAALRELAIMSASFVTVDENRVGSFKARSFMPTGLVRDLDDVLERVTTPVWELYRSSVTVSGDTEADTEIRQTGGETGDSANRLELSLSIPITDSLAMALANLYVSYLSAVRKQEDVKVPEDGDLIQPLDLVRLDGTRYLVLEARTDLEDREQELVLVEA